MKPRPEPRSLLKSTGGIVYTEFLLAFIPLFTIFLGILQIAFIYAAQLMVDQAAITATRAAVVVLDDNPSRYDDAPRRTVVGSSSSGGMEGGLGGLFGGILGGGGGGGGGSDEGDDDRNDRFKAIRFAAIVPLMPITPAVEAVTGMTGSEGESVAGAIGTWDPEFRAAMGLMYLRGVTAVNFPRAATHSGETNMDFRTDWERPTHDGGSELVTARVTHLYYCAVPIANRLLCESGLSLMLGSAAAEMVGEFTRANADGELSWNELNELMRSSERHERHFDEWSELREEMSEGPAYNGVMVLTAAMYGTMGVEPRFHPLRGEATLPLQAANYCYRDERSSDCWEQEED